MLICENYFMYVEAGFSTIYDVPDEWHFKDNTGFSVDLCVLFHQLHFVYKLCENVQHHTSTKNLSIFCDEYHRCQSEFSHLFLSFLHREKSGLPMLR